jgi:hypothetical protein
LIVQNGNAYDEALREFWEQLKAYWREPNEKNKDALSKLLIEWPSQFFTFRDVSASKADLL